MTNKLEVGIKELDSWLFKGFGGLASAVYNRVKGEGEKIPFDPEALEIINRSLKVLKEAVERYTEMAVGEITPKRFDIALAFRFQTLINMIHHRSRTYDQVRSVDASNILNTEAARWISQIVPGLEAFNRRLADGIK